MSFRIEEKHINNIQVVLVNDNEYPIRTEITDKLNPHHNSLYEHDPTKHGEDLQRYFEGYRDVNGDDRFNWWCI
ncbi:hypothetical protein ACFQJ8_24420 [Halocatena marina]|uniref:hypothetical protein n=1 Tax=Halocatena marina TaxID=2934937 RepID=UPI003607B498